ncbi:hypothetical protein AB0D38_22020, partial [Streptomyces sp. NPDC048279]
MDLTHTPADEKFRAEARAWLAEHVPDPPLPSLETAGGFAAHRAWEAELAADRWSVVSWLSASSFQETTRVLTDAAINAKSDSL